MKPALNMNTTLLEASMGSEWEERSESLPKAVAAMESIRRKIAEGKKPLASEIHAANAPHFDAAVSGFGKALDAADLLSLSEGHLSEMRSGKRPFTVSQLMMMLDSEPAAFRAFARHFCERHGFNIVRRRKATKAEAQRAVVGQAKQLGLVWKALCEVAAADLGTSADDLEAALESEGV